MKTAKYSARRITHSALEVKNGLRPDWLRSETPCPVCGNLTKKKQKTCSRSCGSRWRVMNCPPEVEASRRLKISKRMKVVRTEIPNPMERADIRAKVSATHKERGITFIQRGGNGTGPTRHELMLYLELVRLRPSWLWNLGHAVSNGPRKKGYPTCYKVDVASLKRKVAVEVDGGSHRCRKAQDAKKEEALTSRGWLVLRFTNQQVEEGLTKVVRKIITSTPSL